VVEAVVEDHGESQGIKHVEHRSIRSHVSMMLVLTKIASKKRTSKLLKNLCTSRKSSNFSIVQVRKKIPCFLYQKGGSFATR